MASCAAYGCKNRPQNKVKGITFHRFPRDVNRRQQWILSVRRADWLPTKVSQLCSNHFAEEMFDRSSTIMVRLKREAVPTIFEGFPSHVEQKLDSMTRKATPVKPDPVGEISNKTDIQTGLFSICDKNSILIVPSDLDILSNYRSSNGNTKDQNHVFIISDDTGIQTILNNENVDDNRVIIVSDGTNMQSEWCGNLQKDSFLNGIVTLDDTAIEADTLNNCIADSSYDNPLQLHSSEIIKELVEKMAKLKKKLRILRKISRRNKRKIIRLKKEVSRTNTDSHKCPCSAQPLIHLIDKSCFYITI